MKLNFVGLGLILIIIFSGCTSTSNSQDKSFLSMLNGKNNRLSFPNSFSVRNKLKKSRVYGVVYWDNEGQEILLRNAKIVLKDKNKVLKEVRSNMMGEFSLSLPLDNGVYSLQIISEKRNINTNAIKFDLKDFDTNLGSIIAKNRIAEKTSL